MAIELTDVISKLEDDETVEPATIARLLAADAISGLPDHITTDLLSGGPAEPISSKDKGSSSDRSNSSTSNDGSDSSDSGESFVGRAHEENGQPVGFSANSQEQPTTVNMGAPVERSFDESIQQRNHSSDDLRAPPRKVMTETDIFIHHDSSDGAGAAANKLESELDSTTVEPSPQTAHTVGRPGVRAIRVKLFLGLIICLFFYLSCICFL